MSTSQFPQTSQVTVWKARPIFLSSTFRDMHAERDHLRAFGFKRLEERLRARCHYLDTIDLRQGVENAHAADEAAREMQVLSVCLGEIERSRPFLVALLGDRYGWIPPAVRIAAAAHDAGLPASVDVAGKSVTELEILYGVLENPEQKRRSWFYFRSLDRRGMPPDVAARFPAEEESGAPDSPASKLHALKERIRRELPDRVRDYSLRWDPQRQALLGLEELDSQVEADLWSDLDAETAAYLRAAPRTWQEADARAVADFVAERTRGYVDRPAGSEPMLAQALSPEVPGAPWGLVVTAESGGGKSSLFGTVFDALQPRAAADEVVLLAHAAGIFPLSGQVDRMLRRWVTELAAHLGIDDPIETLLAAAAAEVSEATRRAETAVVTSEEIEKTFAQLLGQVAASVRVVLLIDALNQFEPTIRARHLTWLPSLWPANARLVATAIPGTASTVLAQRPGGRALELTPVSRAEARAIAEKFYRERHHRTVNPRVLDALLDKQDGGAPAYGNPLWLVLALQEMNLLEADDFERAERELAHLDGAARMEALQLSEAAKLPGDVTGVYGELLARAERCFGVAWTRAITGLIALGRAGWRESDLRAIVPGLAGRDWDDLAFAGVRRTLGTHLVQRGAQAQWDFFHTGLRDTVLRRDLAGEAERSSLHGVLVDHLLTLSAADPLRLSETMVHLLGHGDRDRAAAYVAAVNGLSMSDAAANSALAAAVAVLVEVIQAAPGDAERERLTVWIAALLGGDNDERSGLVANAILFDLNHSLAVTGTKETEVPRARLLRAAGETLERLAAADPSNARWKRDLSVSHDKIGDVLRAQGDLGGALQAYRASLAVREHLAAVDPANAGAQRDLSVSHTRIGDVLLAQGDLVGALQAYRLSLGLVERLAATDPANAGWQRDLSVNPDRIGDVLLAQGDLGGALEAYRASLAVRERLAAADPSNAGWQRDLSVSHNNIGIVLRVQGDLDGALQAYRASMAVRERLAAADPSNAGWQRDLSGSHNQIGDVLLAQGDLGGALQAFRASLAVAERLAAADPFNAGWQGDLAQIHINIGDVLLAQGDLGAALQLYRASMAVRERLAAVDPSNAGWTRDLSVSQGRIGHVLRAQGDLGGALQAYRASLAVAERLAAADPSNAGWTRDLSVSHDGIGDVLLAQGDRSAALQAYRASFTIRERLVAADPANADWLRNLSVSHDKIGDVLLAQGDLGGALQAFRASLAVAERLAVADPSNASWQRDLMASYWRMAHMAEKSGNGDAQQWWRRAYETLSAMKQRGIMLPTDEQYLEALRSKLAP